MTNKMIAVTHIAESFMHANENVVDVNYHGCIKAESNGSVEEISERHRMRYLFKPEIDALLKVAQFELILFEEWMTDEKPSFDALSVCWVVKKS